MRQLFYVAGLSVLIWLNCNGELRCGERMDHIPTANVERDVNRNGSAIHWSSKKYKVEHMTYEIPEETSRINWFN